MHARTIAVSLVAAVSLLTGAGCVGDLSLDRGNRNFTELELRDNQRAFWVDHATWVHAYAISTIKDLGDQQVAYDRLLRGTTDYGNSFQTLYGQDAQPQLTRLFRQHVALEAQLIAAVNAQDTQALADVTTRFNDNADRLATALSQTNSKIVQADMAASLKQHLADVVSLAQQIKADNWAQDVAVYDKTVADAVKIADGFVDSFRAAFPERVTVQVIVRDQNGTLVSSGNTTSSSVRVDANGNTIDANGNVIDQNGNRVDQNGNIIDSNGNIIGTQMTAADIALHLALRSVYVDHAMYEKFYVTSAVASLNGSASFAGRLLTNADDIARALQPYMTQGNAEQLARLLRQHVVFSAQVLSSAIALDQAQNGVRVNDSNDVPRDSSGSSPCMASSSSASTSSASSSSPCDQSQSVSGLRERYNAAVRRWQANADAIGTLLAQAIPTIDASDAQAMMRDHLDQILAMMHARIEQRWTDDVVAYDAVVAGVYSLADTISQAVMQQRLNQSGNQNTGGDTKPGSGSCQQSTCTSGY